MMNIVLDAKITPDDRRSVEILVDIEVRDKDLNARYAAFVEFVVFSEFEPFGALDPGEPRPDLAVVGIEFNQAIQAFRSTEHMIISLAMPDNSIPLIENKATCARVYLDYDYTSMIPVGPLTGTLTVIADGTETALAPLLFDHQDRDALPVPAGPASIVAGPDSILSRRDPARTLNFVIPPELCHGAIQLRADLVSTADATHFVRSFLSEAAFTPVTPPAFHLVGVEYAPPGLSVFDPAPYQAPDQATCDRQLDFARRLYPLPSVISMDYQTSTYRVTADAGADLPCDSLSSLLSDLEDLRGDRTGVMVGLLAPGYPLGGGCGRRGTAVCAARIDQPDVIAHELGHALTFKHVACETGECGLEPENINDDLPHYLPYAVGSIGEFGVEIIDNGASATPRWSITHCTPTNGRDVMGYSTSYPRRRWISPYTYLKTFNMWAGSYVPPSPRQLSLSSTAEPDKKQRLYLDITIDRRRETVRLAPTFHYPMLPFGNIGAPTRFSIELLDGEGTVLVSAPILDTSDDDCGCGCGCSGATWPQTYKHTIPYDTAATTLVVYDCDEPIHTADIPPPPQIVLTVTGHDDPCSPHLIVEWALTGEQPCCAACHYLVQVRLADGAWAGVAPRTSKQFLVIEKTRLLETLRQTRLRVLASSGIATGVAEWQGAIDYRPCNPTGKHQPENPR